MRPVLPQAVLWFIALGVGIWVWTTAIHNLNVNAPPFRPLYIEGTSGTHRASDLLRGADPQVIIDGDSFWYAPAVLEDKPGQVAIARVYPAEGRVDTRWTFSTDSEQIFRAAARSSTGNLFVAFTSTAPNPVERYAILYPDRLEEIELVTEGVLRGVAWSEEGATPRIELITQKTLADGFAPPDWLVYTLGEGWETGTVRIPPDCDRCELQVAYREAGAWRLLYADIPSDSGYPSEETPVLTLPMNAIVLADTDGAVLPLELANNQINTAEADTLAVFRSAFDPAAGNVINRLGFMALETIGAFPYVYQDGNWRPVIPPDALLGDGVSLNELGVSQYGNTQILAGERSRWQPHYIAFPETMHYFALVQVGEQWLRLEDQREGEKTLRTIDIQRGFSANFFGFNAVMLSDGAEGIWWVESIYGPGAFMRYDASLNRVNTPGFVERFSIALNRTGPTWWQHAKWMGMTLLIGAVVVILSFVLLALLRRRKLLSWGWVWIPLLYLLITVLLWQSAQQFITDL
jgi:hypothetical protein